MQTFLPYADFETSASVLDNRRLQKQIVECKQIYLALTVDDYGWKNHPAVKMWKGYEKSLCDYALECVFVWQNRFDKEHKLETYFIDIVKLDVFPKPPWFGNDQFHLSHRSNLLRKDYNYYHRFFGSIPTDIPYFWPTKEGY